MIKNKIVFRVRKFINKIGYHEGAFIVAEITRNIYKGRKDKKTGKRDLPTMNHSLTLTIADCSRIVEFSIDDYDENSYKNTLFKLNIMIDTIKEFKEKLEDEHKLQKKLIREGYLKKDD